MNSCRPGRSGHYRRLAHLIAGHAVIGIQEGLEILYASIEPEDFALRAPKKSERNSSEPASLSAADDEKLTKPMIRALLAGPACLISHSFGYYPVEFNLAGRCILDQQSVWRAITLAVKVTDDSPALIHALWDQVMTTIGDSIVWATVENLAIALQDNRTLAGPELTAIVRSVQ